MTTRDDHSLPDLAVESIRHGLVRGRPLNVEAGDLAGALGEPGACFVSLHDARGRLRGCIGTLDAHRALAVDCAQNAFAAAFRDPRMDPVAADELDALTIEVHVLTPLAPMRATNLDELLDELRAGEDGLEITVGDRRAVFLPVMWEQLPQSVHFVDQLLHKAGASQVEARRSLSARRFGARLLRSGV